MAFPLWLQGRDIDNNTAAGIGRFAQADGQHRTRNFKVLNRSRQRKTVGRDNAEFALHIHKGIIVEILRVYRLRMHISKHLKLIRTAHIVAVA